MKKMIIAFTLLTSICTFACAETIDLSSMNTEELMILREKITDEIVERVIDEKSGGLIYPGDYIVGKDLKAGTYLITSVECYEDVEFCMNAFPNKDSAWSERINHSASVGESFYIVLTDGMYVEFARGTGYIQTIDKPNWAP